MGKKNRSRLFKNYAEIRNGRKNEAGQTTSTGRTANDGRKAQNKRQPKPGNGNYPVGSNELSAEINERQKAEAEKKFRLKMDQDGKNVHLEEFTPAPTRKRNKPQKNAPQLAVEDRKRLKNEEQTGREIIFHGIPTPMSYSEGTKSEEAKKILAVLEELRTKYFGKTDGVNVSPSDFAFATRQQGHFKKDFKPLTARFRDKGTVQNFYNAARVAGMLNKRREVLVGKHRIPNPITIDGKEIPASEAVVQRALERPQTYIRRTRTEVERKRDKATRIYRESARYKESQDVKTFLREQKIDFTNIEVDPVEADEEEEGNEEEYGTPRSSASSAPAEVQIPLGGEGGSGTANEGQLQK